MPFPCLLIFFKIDFFKRIFRKTFRVSNSLDPDQAQRFIGPDLSPNCLQSLLADSTSRQRVNIITALKGKKVLFHMTHHVPSIGYYTDCKHLYEVTSLVLSAWIPGKGKKY